ncbi:hypothetical protein IIA79_02160, partial [bacterium]|nr:hypothetical protein [bacterium]
MALRRNLHLWLIPVWILLGACGKSGSGIQEYAAPAGGPFSEEISALEAPERIDAALWEELKAALVLELARSGADKASAAPTAHPLSKVPDFRVSLGPSNSAIFEWSYRNHGDYDQNGEVNIADLTPVGQNFGAMIGDPGWAAAQVADGDGNGEVNIADISPIGQNFLASVEGYVLQTSQTPAQEA